MNPSVIVAIAIPSVAIVFNAGVQTQTLRELKRIVKDLETRVRNLENGK